MTNYQVRIFFTQLGSILGSFRNYGEELNGFVTTHVIRNEISMVFRYKMIGEVPKNQTKEVT